MKAKPKTSAMSRKRSAAHSGKPAKAASAEKASRVAAPKAHAKAAAAPKRATARVHEAPAADPKPAVDKRLGGERRPIVMPEDRQSQLKLLIARGKEQGYLTYAQVNDHLPSEIVDPE